MPTPSLPVIPETVTVHLGAPSENANNVTVSFPDYIKNVASSEIYPTWPENAIRANIYAQISFALNRIYTEYYRVRGYPFDITNSTAIDQSFVYGRDIFENISQIVDSIFNSYIQRQGNVEPLFAQYCDGVRVTCDGLSQWGTVSLAEQGLLPYQILQYYYGDNINIVTDVPIQGISGSAPLVPLRYGFSGPDVQQIQVRLNRISNNYPAIPKIYPTDGVYGRETEQAVTAFQEIFNLTPDGIVGNNTWYRIAYIYNSVKRLNELNSEGLTLNEISSQYPNELSSGSTGEGVFTLQYYLSYIANFVNTVQKPRTDGIFGAETEQSVRDFQRTYGLPVTGVVEEVTWSNIYNVYLGLVSSVPLEYREGVTVPFPGVVLRRGATGEDVRVLQEYLNYVANVYTEIPQTSVTGNYGSATENAVTAFQELFGLDVGRRGVVGSVTWAALMDVYEDIYRGNRASTGQYPGYTVS
ncbi:MAG: peptidoglycan-binding protein [Ruminococcaceae bacterium]|nr:peptidoglycan-binding protein [Oscillospiraceae bacterium]